MTPMQRRWKMPTCSAALLLASWAGAALAAAPVDAGWVLAKIARPAPMQTRFVEIHNSAYLKTPLRVLGEYSRPDDATLVRKVFAPYPETTTLRNGNATIVRGTQTRTFALSRAPELANLQTSFGAMLRGDQAQLNRDFQLTAKGTRERWTLLLKPKSAAIGKRITDITLYGQGAELRCIETRSPRAATQRTLLASAAQAVKAATPDTRLVTLCHGQ